MSNETDTPAGADAEPGIMLTQPTSHIDENGKTVFTPSRGFLLAFGALCVVTLAVAFDATTLSVALPIMSAALGGTALEAFWSGISFLLASAVLQPTFASLSTIFGRKNLLYLCSIFFAVGSIVGAVANNFTVVIVGRTIQGVGGGGLIALTEVIVTDLVPLAFRGQWFSVLSAMWSIGTVSGPLIGSSFSQNVTWRWIFWINVPIIAAGVVMVFFFLNQAKLPGQFGAKLARFDWLGSFLFTAGSTSLLFGISTGGVMYDWSSWRVLVSILLGAAVIVIFAFWELNWAKEPVVERGIFNNWTMLANYIMTIFHSMILWSLLYFVTLYYQGVKLYTPIISAVAVLPETLTVAPAAMVVGVVASMTGKYRWSLWAGWALTTLGAGLLYLLTPESTIAQWVWLNIPIGVGTGMLFPAMALSIQAACEPALNGQAAAFFSFLRTFGQSIGVAVSGVIFQNSFRDKLLAVPAFAPHAREYSRDATLVVEMIKQMPNDATRHGLIVAYNDALKMIWISMIAFAGASMLISLSVKSYSLNQEHVSSQKFVEKEGRLSGNDTESGTDIEKA